MPTKSTDKSRATENASHAESTAAVPQDAALNVILSRLSQQFNLLAILVVALFLFQAYTFYKIKDVEKNGTVAGTGNGQPAESPLSKDKLIAYAKDIGLDETKFGKCLESGEKKAKVEAESKEGAALNVQGTPGFFINGRFLNGAFPFETFKEIIDKEIAGTATNECTSYSTDLQQYCSDPSNMPFNPVPQKVDIGDAPSRGPANAKITIIEFSDFECPFCQRAFTTVEQIMNTYPKDVRLVYKQLPLVSIHPHAMAAAQASLCAKDQGKFWEYHDKMFKTQLGQ